jgi:hypothetical protein
MSRIFVLIAPLLASVAAQTITTGTTPDPVTEIARSVLNLGVGGVLAWIFYQQWRTEIAKREAAELRERQILRTLANLAAEHTSPDDITIPVRPALHIVDTQQSEPVNARG